MLKIILIMLLSLHITAMSEVEHSTQSSNTPDVDHTAKGKELYAHHCSHCHGFNMVNAGNYAYDLRKFPEDQYDRFLDSVTNGKNGRMPPWKEHLQVNEIEDIWAYVLTRGKSQ